MIKRGTTPTHTFTAEFEIPAASKIRAVYSQNDNIIFECTTERCTVNGSVISLKLTDKETLLFDCSPHYINGKNEPYPVEIQVGIETPDGNKIWSDIIVTTVYRCLRKDGVI